MNIPEYRVAAWKGNIGVPGGIPNRANIAAELQPGDDIQTAALAAPPFTVVLLSPGDFIINERIDLLNIAEGVVIRGSGRSTRLLFFGGYLHLRGAFYNGFDQADGIRSQLTSDAAIGDYTVYVNDTSWVVVGDALVITAIDDPAFVNKDGTEASGSYAYAGNRGMGQLGVVVSKTDLSVTFDKPLVWDYTMAFVPELHKCANSFRKDNGIENLVIAPQFNNGDINPIVFEACLRCWLKDVIVDNGNRISVWSVFTSQCEYRNCDFLRSHALGPGQGYGVAFYHYSSWNWVDNCTFYRLHNAMTAEFGSCANVFSYCFESQGQAESLQQPALNTHGVHAGRNLFIGCIVQDKALFDFSHGSASHLTLFRNRILGYQPGPFEQRAVHIYEWNRHCTGVGNVLGLSGYHETYLIQAPAVPTEFQKVIMMLGTDAGDGGDDAAVTDFFDHGNYNTVDEGQNFLPGYDHIIPECLIYDTKPDWWPASLLWPPVNPASPALITETDSDLLIVQLAETMPAGIRFLKLIREGGGTMIDHKSNRPFSSVL